MRELKVKYPTVITQRKLGDTTYVMETIRDLDEAIELICAELSPEEQMLSFAEDLCPYFGILWPAAEGLSLLLNDQPDLVQNKKILELGCGLGYPALVATVLGGDVLATDFHPDVEEYFLRNCRHTNISCKYQRLNWREDLQTLGLFDVVMGSDVLYESKHPKEVVNGLIKYLRPGGKIILSDPGRAYLQTFVKEMQNAGFKEELSTYEVNEKGIFVLVFKKDY